jgi:spectinomycin phosphotransferase
MTVSPFVEGRDGYQLTLSDHHWVEFGRALKGIHRAALPSAITDQIQREDYSVRFRESVKRFQIMAEETVFPDPVAAQLAELLRREHELIGNLVRRAEELASILKPRSEPFVVCHADIHAGNVFIDADNRLYIVDWDTLVMAPKERDLMYAGGGQFGNHRPPEEEERLFYQGYGQTEADPVALAYYRYERIVQDIVAYCEEILLAEAGGADRENGLRQLQSQFLPGNVVGMAYRSEQFLPVALRSEL